MEKEPSQEEPIASKTVSLEWKATPEDMQRVLKAAEKGKLDKIAIDVDGETVFLSVEAIKIGVGVPGIPAQTWKRREEGRLIQTTHEREEGVSR